MNDETQVQLSQEQPAQAEDRIFEIVRAPHFQAALERIEAMPATSDTLAWLEACYTGPEDKAEAQAAGISPRSPQSRQSDIEKILAGIDTMGDGDRHLPIGALIGHLAYHFRGDETLVREHALAHLRRADLGAILDGGSNSEFERWLRPICRKEREKIAAETAQRDRQRIASRSPSKLQIVEHIGDPRIRESTFLFDFDFRRTENLPRPKLEWLWEGRLPLKRTIGLSGDGGIGKSTFLFQAAAKCAAGGGDFFGAQLRSCGSYLVLHEDDAEDVIRVGPEILDAMKIRYSDLIHPLQIFTGPDQEGGNVVQIMRFDPQGRQMIETEYAPALTERVSMLEIGLLGIDSLFFVYPGDELDRNGFLELARTLGRMGRRANCCVVPLFHPSKGGMDSETFLSGNRALQNYLRGYAVLRLDADNTAHHVLEWKKLNDGPLPSSIYLRRNNRVFEGLSAAEVADITAPIKDIEKLLAGCTEVYDGGGYICGISGPATPDKVLPATAACKGWPKARIKRLVDLAKEQKVLVWRSLRVREGERRSTKCLVPINMIGAIGDLFKRH